MTLQTKKRKTYDPAAIVVIALTLVLFIVALFVNGFTHDLLLEAAVFLVSAKLILMAKANGETERRLELQLVEIKDLLQSLPQKLTRMPQKQELIESSH
jgi:hypothetical protein